LLPSLHQYGFVPFQDDLREAWKPGKPAEFKYSELKSSIRLLPLTGRQKHLPFIEHVFRSRIPRTADDLLRFLLYYQIIEILLEEVYVHQQASIIPMMMLNRYNPALIRPLTDTLVKANKEAHRFALLINYSNVEAILSDLKRSCNEVLRGFGCDEQTACSDAFYQTRNMLFHNLRSMSFGMHSQIHAVVEELEVAIPSILLRFQLPAGAGPKLEEIQKRAYEIFLLRGCQQGHDLQDWLQAEKELRA